MKFRVLIFALLVSITSCYIDRDEDFFGCERGNGSIVTETLFLEDFSSIKLDISADVCIAQGEVQSVVVEGEQNIINELNLNVRGEEWEIEFDDCVRNHDGLKFFITLPFIDQLRISGSGLIFSNTDLQMERIKLRISGSGDIDVGLDVEEVHSKISGSGTIKMEGIANFSDIEITGSGDVRAFDLLTEDTDVKIRGSGNVEVLVEDRLDVKITGSGDVFYRGNPRVSANISGSGSVIDAN